MRAYGAGVTWGGIEGDAVDKSLVVVGGTLGEAEEGMQAS